MIDHPLSTVLISGRVLLSENEAAYIWPTLASGKSLERRELVRLIAYDSLSEIGCNPSLMRLLELLCILASCHTAQLSFMRLSCLVLDYTFLRGRAKTPNFELLLSDP